MAENKCTKRTVLRSPLREAMNIARTNRNKARRKAKHIKRHPHDVQSATGIQVAAPGSRKMRKAESAARLSEYMARKKHVATR